MTPKQFFRDPAVATVPLQEVPRFGKLLVRNVLCPLDFSEFSRRAFQYAAGIARHFQARLFLEHTVHIPAAMFLEGEALSVQETFEASRYQAGTEIQRLVQQVQGELPEVSVLIQEGDVRDRILQTIAEQKIDLVVMGTHGRRGFNRLVLGSVAEHIVHEAICPVLVVSRPRSDFVSLQEAEPVHLKSVLLATDFSPNSDRALSYALRWASEWSGKVTLFHAVEEAPSSMQGLVDLFPEYNPYFERQIAEAWAKIHRVIPAAVHPRCEVAWEVRQGNPKEQILQFAEEQSPDLIVMGSRGFGRNSVAWGSTISGVVRDGRFPVLAVRHLVN